jgi:hypothetical protein
MLPGIYEQTLTPPRHRITDEALKRGSEVVLDSSNTDSGNTPTYRMRPGNVVVKRTSTGRYVEATDSNADTGTAPSITSSSHSDANGEIKLVGNHGTISVTTSTGTGTEANHVTDLNGDADFAAFYTASSGGGELTIAANRAAADEWFYIHADTIATAGFAEGPSNSNTGTDPDVRVLEDFSSDLQDLDGSAQHGTACTSLAGHYDESALINLTGQAREVLARRGSIFG